MTNSITKVTGVSRVIKKDGYRYTTVPNATVRDPEITANAFRLLVYLLSHEEGYQLHFSQIIRETGLGEHAIRKAIELLKMKGYLETRRQKKGNLRGGYDWVLLDPNNPDPWRDSPWRDYSWHERSVARTTKPLKETKERETKERETKYLDISPKNKFEEFWNAYPRKVSKGEARKAYAKAKEKTTEETLIAKAKAYAKQAGRKDEFTKHPASWLNAEGWLDEYQADIDERAERQRQREWEQTQKMLAEHDKPYEEIPQCEHGTNPALCKECLKRLK